MILISFLFFGLFSFSTEAATGWTTRQSRYVPMNETEFEIMSLATGWPATSVLNCASACTDWIDQCSVFFYDSTTEICTPGRSVCSDDEIPLEPPGGTLYISDFSIYRNGNVEVYMWISSCKANFTMAEQSCREKGGNLIAPQTQEKMDLFLEIAKSVNEQIWIGVDDRQVENEFRWHNDNSVMTSAQRRDFFATNMPDDHQGKEDCLEYNPLHQPLNDFDCDSASKYVCEKEPATS